VSKNNILALGLVDFHRLFPVSSNRSCAVDIVRSTALYIEAADFGDRYAALSAAKCLLDGRGIKRDCEQAVKYLRQVTFSPLWCEVKNEALCYLAYYEVFQTIMPESRGEAFMRIETAAIKGCPKAIYAQGIWMFRGQRPRMMRAKRHLMKSEHILVKVILILSQTKCVLSS